MRNRATAYMDSLLDADYGLFSIEPLRGKLTLSLTGATTIELGIERDVAKKLRDRLDQFLAERM